MQLLKCYIITAAWMTVKIHATKHTHREFIYSSTIQCLHRYVPNISETGWKQFGLRGSVQGKKRVESFVLLPLLSSCKFKSREVLWFFPTVVWCKIWAWLRSVWDIHVQWNSCSWSPVSLWQSHTNCHWLCSRQLQWSVDWERNLVQF